MGVHGWNSVLVSEGWLPDQSSKAMALWLTSGEGTNFSTAITHRLESLPPNAEIYIDGNGLSFFLRSVAVARKVNSVFKNKASRKNLNNVAWSSLNQSEIRELLPTFCPLTLLHETTKEFIEALAWQNKNEPRRKITVYWDGDERYIFKEETSKMRMNSIDIEWSNMHQYCLTGRMPRKSKVHSLEHYFPINALCLTQVKHTLQASGLISMVFCDGEADAEVAKGASCNLNAFIVGYDSDYCFFPNVNYIPVNTLSFGPNGSLSAVVLRRSVLAEMLDLPDEAAILELAMLMGNDYIDPVHAKFKGVGELFKSGGSRKVKFSDLVEFLKQMGPGFRLTSKSNDTKDVLQFIRIFYNLGDLCQFHDVKYDASLTQALSVTIAPKVPEEMNEQLAEISQPRTRTSIFDATCNCLQDYIDKTSSSSNQNSSPIKKEHLNAFQKCCQQSHDNAIAKFSPQNPDWRPSWEDVCAGQIIEKIIAYLINKNPPSLETLLSPPFSLFNQLQFYALLQASRIQEGVSIPAPFVIKTEEQFIENESSSSKKIKERVVLPVDEFEEAILKSVKRNRVTIIQGETGCGKSTRIPVMLLNAPPPHASFDKSRLFIAQPRRIAAKSLVEHLRSSEPNLRDQIALRMGHGVREYETSTTRAWFVTTGYLVRLMSCYPERFDSVSYVIIDEVHERSVSTDILCLLCRRLLQTNHHLRLVLMSATLAAALYQTYFQVPEPPIKVGARRFQVNEIYIEDIARSVNLPLKQTEVVNSLYQECTKMKGSRTPSMSYMEKLYSITSFVAFSVGKPGSSVLIFVPGMNDIIQITELIEAAPVPGVSFTCFPIHSDIPFEDQMKAFSSAGMDEVKIIIATNAAESSVTIPDVDHIICLGLCKQITYNAASHRQMLQSAWISRASAEQRKGRAGRLRPGTVYRMYPKEMFDNFMEKFEPGEISRMPLDSVILMLKVMLPKESATELLQNCLEPPDVKNINRSFLSLHESQFITEPNDDCDITTLGSFVSTLGLDLMLGSLIGLGIQFGIGAEAIQIAAILSFPKTPWIISNPLVHDPKSYNETTAKTYVSKCHFDANLYSDPLATMNLLWDYENSNEKSKWCLFYGIHQPRLNQLNKSYLNLRRRVADFTGVGDDKLIIEAPPNHLPHGKINIIRIIQVWVFHDSIIQFQPKQTLKDCITESGVTLTLGPKNPDVSEVHLRKVLKKKRHPFTLMVYKTIQQKGAFSTDSFSLPIFECRLLSYASDADFTVVWIGFPDVSAVYIRDLLTHTSGFEDVMKHLLPFQKSILKAKIDVSKNKRGIKERPCGRYSIIANSDETSEKSEKKWERFNITGDNKNKKLAEILGHYCKIQAVEAISVNCHLSDKRSRFDIVVRSSTAEKISNVALNDLFFCDGC
mmetsp:Transcript_10144/g.14653  ORF Transcript_10144/g.14653 Transcript_10144/m.14653 type:complete len:1391 (-) Transcript_10144:2876-7048(-)